MPTLTDVKEKIRELAIKGHAVVTDDALSAAEKREQTDAIEAELKSWQAQYVDLTKVEENRGAFLKAVGGEPTADKEVEAEATEKVETKSLGRQLVESSGFQQVKELVGKASTFTSIPIELKATLLQSGLTDANVIVQDRQPGVLPILFQRPMVADLMPQGRTNSNVVRYAKESTATNAAAAVAEGAAKPESTLNFTIVDEPVRKVATTIKVSDEMLEDEAQMESYIEGRLRLFVQLAEETQLLTGSGVAPNITGILNRSGLTAAQAKGTDTIAVAVHKEITKIRVASFLDPDGIVFHPNDWEAARLEADSNGQFFGGGPFTGPYGVNGIAGDTYWGLRVVATTSETENTILIGAFRLGAQVFRRNDITVEMTNSNEDDFKKNLVAVRAEERLALAVYRPAAFGTVTGV